MRGSGTRRSVLLVQNRQWNVGSIKHMKQSQPPHHLSLLSSRNLLRPPDSQSPISALYKAPGGDRCPEGYMAQSSENRAAGQGQGGRWAGAGKSLGRESGAKPGATHHVVFSLENLMPGTRPMRRTIMCRQLLLVSSRTALPIVVLSRLSPFTSVILSPTHRPARSAQEQRRVNPPSGVHRSVDSSLIPNPLSKSGLSLPSVPAYPWSRDDYYPWTASFCYPLKREAHPKPRSPSGAPAHLRCFPPPPC